MNYTSFSCPLVLFFPLVLLYRATSSKKPSFFHFSQSFCSFHCQVLNKVKEIPKPPALPVGILFHTYPVVPEYISVQMSLANTNSQESLHIFDVWPTQTQARWGDFQKWVRAEIHLPPPFGRETSGRGVRTCRPASLQLLCTPPAS